ncbi:MAG: hypothetical protein PHP53_24340 [Prolixibacteraceae bacterium]|nr:hypothetical protein [Prolixibacteraceae bacterium]
MAPQNISMTAMLFEDHETRENPKTGKRGEERNGNPEDAQHRDCQPTGSCRCHANVGDDRQAHDQRPEIRRLNMDNPTWTPLIEPKIPIPPVMARAIMAVTSVAASVKLAAVSMVIPPMLDECLGLIPRLQPDNGFQILEHKVDSKS